jgi:hypothetical protein
MADGGSASGGWSGWGGGLGIGQSEQGGWESGIGSGIGDAATESGVKDTSEEGKELAEKDFLGALGKYGNKAQLGLYDGLVENNDVTIDRSDNWNDSFLGGLAGLFGIKSYATPTSQKAYSVSINPLGIAAGMINPFLGLAVSQIDNPTSLSFTFDPNAKSTETTDTGTAGLFGGAEPRPAPLAPKDNKFSSLLESGGASSPLLDFPGQSSSVADGPDMTFAPEAGSSASQSGGTLMTTPSSFSKSLKAGMTGQGGSYANGSFTQILRKIPKLQS